MLKVSAVAARLCVGHQTVLDWIIRGVRSPGGGVRKLRATRVGRSWRVTEEDLEEFSQRSEDMEDPKPAGKSLRTERKIRSEVDEYWRVMSLKKKK